MSPKCERESTAPKFKETKIFEAVCSENAAFRLAILRASEDKEFPRAMPKEARANAAEEDIVSEKLKETKYS